MNERQLEHLEELKRWLQTTLGDYGYTDDYTVETKDTEEDYTEVTVKVKLQNYDKQKRDYVTKEIYLEFEIYEDKITINLYEDSYNDIDYSNYETEIWRKMFFEK